MRHKTLCVGAWPAPSAGSLSEIPNFDGEWPRPCSLGMTRSQNRKDSEW